MFKKTLMAAVVAAFVAAFAAGAAFAGETTGNFGTSHGKNNKETPIGAATDEAPHASSICSFSGQNPELFLPEFVYDEDGNIVLDENGDPVSGGFEPGRTQSWGQIPKADRDFLTTIGLAPGDSCNGHTGFFAGGGSE